MPTVTYNWQSETAFFVNDLNTAGTQTLPAIASINGGTRYFTAWFDPSGSVQGRIVTGKGIPIGSEFLVNATTTNVQTDPSIVQLIGGNIIVTYTDYSVDAGGDIRARIFDSAGVAGAEIPITVDSSDDTDSHITALVDGGFVVSYTRDFGGGDLDVRATILNSNGTVRVAQVNSESSLANAGSGSQVAGLANGNFVIVWEQVPVAGVDSSVWFQIEGPNGTSVVAATSIDAVGSINRDIQVIALADGGFAVAYTDNGWGGDQTEITLKFFNANGSARTDLIRVNTDTVGVQDSPTLASLPNGFVVVGWKSGASSLLFQAYTPAGVRVGENQVIQGSVVEAEIAGLAGGYVANVRESTFTDGSENSIRSEVTRLVRTTVGDGTNEILVGDSLLDSINGLGGDDVISGRAAGDALTGGAGSDTFSDTAADLNGDLITDFAVGDRIRITDANLAEFAYAYAPITLSFTGGSLTVSISNANRVVARAAEGGGVELALNNADYDFNGDGRSDLAWLHADATFTSWLGQPNGSLVANGGSGANALDASWRIVGAGDFDGDGKDDILWRHSTGEMGQWRGQSNGVFVNNSGVAANAVDNSWAVIGVADYNGDGRDDVIWRHNTGAFTQWQGQSNGSFTNNSGAAANTVDLSWTVVASGDFNGDGRADVLWRHTSGVFAEWQGSASGALINAGAVMAGATGTVVGTGDFNGDAREDVLTRGDNGSINVWLGQANGQLTAFTPTQQLLDLNWKINAIGDYNGDGRDDLMWRHTSGAAGEWLGISTGDFAYNGAIPTVETNWQIQSPDIMFV